MRNTCKALATKLQASIPSRIPREKNNARDMRIIQLAAKFYS